MKKLNYKFFEEFKKLDKICREIYNSDIGVTNYINDMKFILSDGHVHIKNFESDLNDLIHLRHIRNHLAHSEGGFNEEICTPNDIELTKKFYYRILTADDPIALVHKNKKQPEKISKNNYEISFRDTLKSSKNFDFQKNCLYWILMIIILILLFLIPQILVA